MIVFLVCVFLVIVLSVIAGVIIGVKQINADALSIDKIKDIELSPEFIKCSKFRKKDGIIEKGSCSVRFDENKFFITQNTNQIENEINSIYYLDLWNYKDETYFKIMMRSHIEYMFKSVNFDADKVKDIIGYYQIKIEDKR